MNEIVPQSAEKKDNKDTLFGPSVGVTNNTPDWCSGFKENDENDDEKKDFIDELTPDVVKEWIRRSKDVCITCFSYGLPLRLMFCIALAFRTNYDPPSISEPQATIYPPLSLSCASGFGRSPSTSTTWFRVRI